MGGGHCDSTLSPRSLQVPHCAYLSLLPHCYLARPLPRVTTADWSCLLS